MVSGIDLWDEKKKKRGVLSPEGEIAARPGRICREADSPASEKKGVSRRLP